MKFQQKDKKFVIFIDFNRYLMIFQTKEKTSMINFFQTMHPKNIKQIITNRELPILLKDILIKIFGDLVTAISIF